MSTNGSICSSSQNLESLRFLTSSDLKIQHIPFSWIVVIAEIINFILTSVGLYLRNPVTYLYYCPTTISKHVGTELECLECRAIHCHWSDQTSFSGSSLTSKLCGTQHKCPNLALEVHCPTCFSCLPALPLVFKFCSSMLIMDSLCQTGKKNLSILRVFPNLLQSRQIIKGCVGRGEQCFPWFYFWFTK